MMRFPALASVKAASILTTAGACCGVTAIAFASRGHYALAASAIGFAILFDFLDGFVARTLDQTSAFGARLDSLADAVSFCVAPPLIAWLSGFDGWGTPLLIGYFACGVWRLAYFDVTGLDGDGRFVGVPTTNAACWWTMLMAGVQILSPSPPVRDAVFAAFFLLGAVLMVSSLRVPKRGWYPVAHGVGVAVAVLSLLFFGQSAAEAGLF